MCATAAISPTLIAGSAIADAAASVLFTREMPMIEAAVTVSERPVHIASISTVFGLSAVLGPIVSGALTHYLACRWYFWINLPIGFATFLGVMLLRLSSNPKKYTSPFKRVSDTDNWEDVSPDSLPSLFPAGSPVWWH